MILTNKLLPVALVAALIGGSVGAFVMYSRNDSVEAKSATASQNLDAQYASANNKESYVPAEFNTTAEQTAYKSGFADGFRACEGGAAGMQMSPTAYRLSSQPRVVYRNAARSSTAARSSSA